MKDRSLGLEIDSRLMKDAPLESNGIGGTDSWERGVATFVVNKDMADRTDWHGQMMSFEPGCLRLFIYPSNSFYIVLRLERSKNTSNRSFIGLLC